MLMDILYDAADQMSDAKLIGIIGSDGIGVEMLLDADTVPHDLLTAELELASLVSANAKTAERMNVGNVYDVMMQTDELTYMLSFIIPGYYAVLGVFPDSNMERARFVLWQMVNRCQREL